jgi:hypothetical protein
MTVCDAAVHILMTVCDAAVYIFSTNKTLFHTLPSKLTPLQGVSFYITQ